MLVFLCVLQFCFLCFFFFFSSRRRHTRCSRDWSSDVCSSDLLAAAKRLLSGFTWTGAFQVVMGEEATLDGVPNLALRAERAPNAKGAEQLGYTRGYAPALAAAKTAAVALVLDDPDCAVETDGALIYLGTVLGETAACR